MFSFHYYLSFRFYSFKSVSFGLLFILFHFVRSFVRLVVDVAAACLWWFLRQTSFNRLWRKKPAQVGLQAKPPTRTRTKSTTMGRTRSRSPLKTGPPASSWRHNLLALDTNEWDTQMIQWRRKWSHGGGELALVLRKFSPSYSSKLLSRVELSRVEPSRAEPKQTEPNRSKWESGCCCADLKAREANARKRGGKFGEWPKYSVDDKTSPNQTKLAKSELNFPFSSFTS